MRLDEKQRNRMQGHALRLMIPLLGKDVDLVYLGQSPRDLYGVTLGPACGDETADEDGDFHVKNTPSVVPRHAPQALFLQGVPVAQPLGKDPTGALRLFPQLRRFSSGCATGTP